jgi:heptaprenyl diphosphate synthase
MIKSSIQKITRLALLLAIGVVINYGESLLLPLAFIAPGVKLGLANTIGLIVLYYFGLKEFVTIGFLRVLLTALFTGFGFNFYIALAGWALATIVVIIFYCWQRLSIFGLSMTSAVMHGVGQIIMVAILYQSPYIINYLPVLFFTGIVSGLLIAVIAREVVSRVRLTIPLDEYEK